MFSCDLNLGHIDAKPERVVSLIRSLNKIDLIPQDGGDGEPEPTEAFIAGVQRDKDHYEIFAYLFHERTYTPRIYVWDGDPVTRAEFANVEAQALDFIESMGFMMDNTQFRKQSPEQRQELFDSVPVFSKGGGQYRELIEQKVDHSLLDLSDDLVDLEENPEAFEEEKQVVSNVDVDAYEGREEEKRKSVFDQFETGEAAAEEPVKNPFDDFDSASGSEFDSSAFDDVAPPSAAKARAKPAKAAAAAGGEVSELVENPDEETGALEALSGDLDTALDEAPAEAVEVEDLPDTEEVQNAEDVEEIAEVAEIAPEPAVPEAIEITPEAASADGIEITFDEPGGPPPASMNRVPKPAPVKVPPRKEAAVDFGELADDSVSAGGAADFGDFLDEKPAADTAAAGGAAKAQAEDDFMSLASGGDDLGDLDEFVGGSAPAEDKPASGGGLFDGDEDLAADLDKSLDDILSVPPPVAAAANAADAAEEVLDDSDLGQQAGDVDLAPDISSEVPAQAPADGNGSVPDGFGDDMGGGDGFDVTAETPSGPPPEVPAPVPATVPVQPAAPAGSAAAAPAAELLSPEEKAERLRVYGRLFATL